MNVFQGEGGVVNELLYIAGVGVNPGEQTVYYMCKTWLQRYMVGGIWGVTLK